MIVDGKKIPSRVTVKRLRRVAEMAGVDLTVPDDKLIQEFLYSPTMVCTVTYWLYKDHLDEYGITEEDWEELCGTTEIAALRAEVTDQMKSFSPYWKTVCTVVEETLSGSTEEILERVQKLTQAQDPPAEVSGPSS